MSNYTTQVRFICERLAGYTESQDGTKVSECIALARPKIFDFDYPVPVAHKEELEKKILNNFYFREIGFETYGLWKNRLQNKLNIIMPYYSKMYTTIDLDFGPFDEVDLTKVTTTSNNGTSTNNKSQSSTGTGHNEYQDTNTTTANTNGINALNDTPQGQVVWDEVTDLKYVTKVTKDDGHSDGTATGSGHNDSENTLTTTNQESGTTENNGSVNEHISGKQSGKSKSELLQEYRSSIINIDNMILEELEPLFMQVW